MSKFAREDWTYFVGNANGRGLIRIETGPEAQEVAGLHLATLHRGAAQEERARVMTAAPFLLLALRSARQWVAMHEPTKHRDAELRVIDMAIHQAEAPE